MDIFLTDKELFSFFFFFCYYFFHCINCSLLLLDGSTKTSPHSQQLTTESLSLRLGWANKTWGGQKRPVSRMGATETPWQLPWRSFTPDICIYSELPRWFHVAPLKCLEYTSQYHVAKASLLSPCSTCKCFISSPVLCMLNWTLQRMLSKAALLLQCSSLFQLHSVLCQQVLQGWEPLCNSSLTFPFSQIYSVL